MKLKHKKGFTLIELIVVIAVLGILVLLSVPRLLGYTDKAQLTRIQHDTKIMEQEMEQIIIEDETKIDGWQDNGKELGVLVMQEKLFEKEGVAKNVNRNYDRKSNPIVSSLEPAKNSSLGVGGEEYELTTYTEKADNNDGDGYKIVPNDYKSKIKTKLKGTFYTNDNGKVYYENDRPLKVDKDDGVACESPEALPDYEFDHETGTVVKWHGNDEHLVIPHSFKNTDTGECTTVRIIGQGAFMQGGFQSVIIPDTVTIIRDDAFKDNEITEIDIPHSVTEVGNGAFDNNYITSGSGNYGNSNTNFGGSGNFEQNGVGGNSSISPEYKAPSASDVEVVFKPGTGTIVSGSPENPEITIPNEINVGGVNYPVVEIAKGAYQGLGLKSVVLPSGLERIEDYAFAGNQLGGITIPEKVSYIGHYAFAFNEQSHYGNKSKRATIKTIKMQNGTSLEEQFSKLDNYGDIQNGGKKASKIGIIELRDFIFVTSINNHIIDEKYEGVNPVPPNTDLPEKPEGGIREPEADELPIYTAEDLNNMRNNLGAKYILMADIDLSSIENWVPIGQGTYAKSVKGIDGNGFKIKNLKIDRATSESVGFYGKITNAEITNLALENVNVVGHTSVGGIVGEGSGLKISKSYVTGSVKGADAGMIVGKGYNSLNVEDSYAKGSVKGDSYSKGGLFGDFYNSSKATNSYAVVKVEGRGGALAWNMNTSSGAGAKGLHWNTELSGQTKPFYNSSNSEGTTGNTDAAMKKQDTYKGWDFDTVWEIKEGQSYPTLKNVPQVK